MGLISELKLDLVDCNRRFGINFKDKFADQLAALKGMESDGLLSITEEEISIHHLGRPFLRNICMPFDAYLENHEEDGKPPRFSATI
jgi:oxygen-independent coproporphyrinogen-3 oxidase